MKILTVIGARPQFVKAAVVSRAISSYSDMQEVIVHTGQHFDANMSDVFFRQMEIPTPNYNLNVNGLGHGAMTGRMLEGIEAILLEERPDMVLVFGDTNSTLAGALAAKKIHIPVCHVEAGLRSFNMKMPEEVNRILTDRISDILFCPTQTSVDNLRKEGYDNIDAQISLCGDVMYDAAMYYSSRAKKPSFDIPSNYILATIHRAENTDDPTVLNSIFSALEIISERTPVLIPIHPRTKSKLAEINYDFGNSRIIFVDSVGYFEMIYLIKNSKLVMTDSGGLQKEAYFFNKFCVTLREETEWVELVENGYNILAGSDTEKIVDVATEMLTRGDLIPSEKLYGDGDAGEIIVKTLRNE